MKNAVIYVRVSSADQVNGTSLDSQELASIKYCESKGYRVDKIFREEGSSAKYLNRPQLLEMIAYCSKNPVNYCVVWKVDRFARIAEDHMKIKALLRKNGTRLASATEAIDNDDPMSQLLETMLAAFAEFDNALRSSRSSSGMKVRMKQSGWTFYAPIGYLNAKTVDGIPSLVPSEMAGKLKEFLKEFAKGIYSAKHIAKYALEAGLVGKGGKKLSNQTIINILRNPIYAGYVKGNMTEGELMKGVHKPLISEATYYKIQGILDRQSHLRRNEAKLEEWPLRGGFMVCSVCSKPITGSSPKGRKAYYPRYSCPKCRAKEVGYSTSKSREAVHEEFLEVLGNIRPADEVCELFKTVTLNRWNQEYKDLTKQRSALEIRRNQLAVRKQRTIDLFVSGKLTDEQKDMQYSAINDQLETVQKELAETSDDELNKDVVIDEAVKFMKNVKEYWLAAPLELKIQLQDLIFPEGIEYGFNSGFGTAKMSPAYQLVNQLEAKNLNLVGEVGIEPTLL